MSRASAAIGIWIVGTVGLGAVAATWGADHIEGRIAEDARAALTSTPGADGVEVEAIGRDLVLRGEVGDPQTQGRIIAVLSDISGVAEVVDDLDVAAATTAPAPATTAAPLILRPAVLPAGTIEATFRTSGVTLTGQVDDEAVREEMAVLLADDIGADRVKVELGVGAGPKREEGRAFARLVVRAAPLISRGRIVLSDDRLVLVGEVPTDADRQGLVSRAKQLFRAWDVSDGLRVLPPATIVAGALPVDRQSALDELLRDQPLRLVVPERGSTQRTDLEPIGQAVLEEVAELVVAVDRSTVTIVVTVAVPPGSGTPTTSPATIPPSTGPDDSVGGTDTDDTGGTGADEPTTTRRATTTTLDAETRARVAKGEALAVAIADGLVDRGVPRRLVSRSVVREEIRGRATRREADVTVRLVLGGAGAPSTAAAGGAGPTTPATGTSA